jgi:hypothetical protein
MKRGVSVPYHQVLFFTSTFTVQKLDIVSYMTSSYSLVGF